ncbi:S-glutathionyl-(chloro)hydroquinone reductase [Basidiobolus ranarum]|uniref:S-glutathionyl-(Chloro)hydroquinone reductase n=1 Tax=Basidiobolus ranarum TaxID=34480 RepID=A0ABR2W395_9FUNG
MSTQSTDKNIYKWASGDGEFRRKPSTFRNTISKEEGSLFTPEKDRYHLYISHACPWAHRTLLVRSLKGLQDIIGLSVVDYLMGPKGWKFSTSEATPGCIPDSLYNSEYARDLYFKANPEYDGRFTVPILWDKKLETIVNNESSEIIRIFNEAFDEFLPDHTNRVTYYPENLRKDIDQVNEWIYETINNGVYKSGFATTQQAYETNCVTLFKSLDRVEKILTEHEFLVGETFTEADIRLWTTIIRFDPVYHGHFKCNIKSIEKDYPNILRWTRQIYQLPHVKETVHMDHIKKHYYMSHVNINPTQVVPLGNGPDLANPIIKKSL